MSEFKKFSIFENLNLNLQNCHQEKPNAFNLQRHFTYFQDYVLERLILIKIYFKKFQYLKSEK